MAAVGITNTGSQSKSCRFFSVLSSAISEWSLIIILLINAVLAYVATRFARFRKLPAPCLLCSRLDHILGNEKRGFYRSLFCHAHKMDISSLAYCHGHRKLADFREMCDACLLSSAATMRKPKTVFGSNLEDDDDSHDKIGREDVDNVSLLNEDLEPDSLGARLCSCCSEPLNLRKVQQAKKTKKVGGGASNRRTQLRKKLEKSLESTTTAPNFDLASHVGYSELKISSDSESEAPFSGDDEDDDGYLTKDIKEESVVRCRPQPAGVTKKDLEDIVPERLIHPNPVVVPQRSSHVDVEGKPANEGDSWDKSSPVSEAGRGLEDINWSNADAKTNPVESFESTPERVPRQVTTETCGVDRAPASTNPEIGKLTSSPSITSQMMMNDIGAYRNDSFKNALAKKGMMLSPRFSEIVASKAQEGLKVRLSQKSYRMLDLPWSDVTSSPRLLGQGDESPSSIGLMNIPKRLSVERNFSSLENFDLSEIEGETSVDRLKQLIELDRKSMSALYKELEEERNASAVAANETMAMINRLQEEKASMQMEALQYLRMMEEQAEYDQEAIQKLNDLLTDREKELLDLEAELESCKKRLGEESEEKSSESASASESRELNSPCGTPRRMKLLSRSKSEKTNMSLQEGTDYGVKGLMSGFEEEKAHISTCLKRLHDKFHLLSSLDETTVDSKEEDQPDGASSSTNDTENGEHSEPAVKNDELDKCNLENSCNGVENLSENGSSPSRKNSNINDQMSATTSRQTLEDEVWKLKERLNALDADREFLVHAMNALKYGADGVQLVQEIASQLKELRRVPVAEKEQTVA